MNSNADTGPVPGTRVSTRYMSKPIASVVDVFCGAGGLSHGFLLEGFEIACGIDIDEACRYPFEHNNDAPFLRRDIVDVDPLQLDEEFAPSLPRILVGCAPCQPFSKYTQAKEDPKWKLLSDFASLISNVRPDVVSMENVPQLLRFKNGEVFDSFVERLDQSGYSVVWNTAHCPDYGVPQVRSRLVLIASLHGMPSIPKPTHTPSQYETVHDAIGAMPALEDGSIDSRDPLHRASSLSNVNLERIRASRPGGTWRDWPVALIAECHKRPSGKGYSSIYGRMTWADPAPTITTQFYGFGNGRFGHPNQDRAISLREGALLQSFPRDYAFVAPEDRVQFTTAGRLIGNAVPVKLARAIARSIKDHLTEVCI